MYRGAWNDDHIFLHFRCGPLEFPKLDGYGPHVHCDLLSFNLSINGLPVFWDSGTYSYSHRDWRLYFRTSGAHNTFRLEGMEQALCTPAFASTSHPEAALTVASDGSVEGRIHITRDGADAVLKRKITLFPSEARIHFVDTIACNARGQVCWFLNIHPDIRPIKDNVFVTPDAQCGVTIDGPLQFCLENAWYSPEYGVKHPMKRAVAYEDVASRPLSVEWDLVLEKKVGRIT